MATSVNDPIIGTLVDNRYLVQERVARGGMATVYRATDRRLGRTVALKVMHAHLAEGTSGQNFVARFRREARAAARVTHPGLVAVYDQGVDGDISYLTLEFVEGTDLRALLERSGTLTLAEALAITEDILDALAAAHRSHLVHRDVKPENVLLSKDNEVKLTDFGLARAVTEVTSTTTGTILGTVAYLAPELVTNGVGDTRTDIYSVGIMLYEMLVGSQPFTGDAPIHIAFRHINEPLPSMKDSMPWLPQPVEALIVAFTAKDPGLRPADAGEALRLLKTVQADIKPAFLARRATPPARPNFDSDVPPPVIIPITDLETSTMDAIDDFDADPLGFDDIARNPSSGGSTTPEPATPATAAGVATGAASGAATGSSPEPNTHQETTRLDYRGAGTTIALPLDPAAYEATSQAEALSGSEDLEQSTEAQPKRKAKRIILVTLLLALLGAGTYGGWYWWGNIGPGSFVVVPSHVAGVTEEEALARFVGLALNPEVIEAHNDLVPAGQVISAEPSSGERIKKDSTVELTVSLGIEVFKVPAGITETSVQKATKKLKDVGFANVKELRVYDTKVKKGRVMESSVKEGATLPYNTEITLTVSNGPEPITIPQVVGKTADDAKELAETFELKLTSKNEFSDDIPKGQIISQKPTQGSAGHRGDSLSIVVSKGPELVKVPDVTGKTIEEAKSTLTGLGFKVKENLYFDGFFGMVRFQDIKAGEEVPKGTTISLTVF